MLGLYFKFTFDLAENHDSIKAKYYLNLSIISLCLTHLLYTYNLFKLQKLSRNTIYITLIMAYVFVYLSGWFYALKFGQIYGADGRYYAIALYSDKYVLATCDTNRSFKIIISSNDNIKLIPTDYKATNKIKICLASRSMNL